MERARWACLAAGVALYAALAVSSLRVKSATYDEPLHLTAGYTYLARGDYRVNPQHPPLAKTLAAAGLLGLDVNFRPDDPAWREGYQNKLARQFLYHWNDADRLLFRARLPIVALGCALLVSVFLWTQRLAGATAASIALLLAALNPDLLAHGQLVTMDLAVTLFIFLTVVAFERLGGGVTPGRVAVAGLALGAALATKASALALVPILGALSVVLVRQGARVRAVAAALVGMALVAFLVVWASYGFHAGVSRDPAAPAFDWSILPATAAGGVVRALRAAHVLPEPYVYGLAFRLAANAPGSEGTAGAFLHGELSANGWWSYFPITFAVKTPLPLILLAAAALFFAFRSRAPRAEWFLWLPVALYAALTIAQRLNIGHRYLLPLYPFLCVAAGRAAARLLESRPGRLAVGALLAWYAAGTLLLHPHYLAYFNETIGGPRHGYRWLVDSNLDWGQDLPGLAAYLRAHHEENVKLSYFGIADPAYYGIGGERLPGFPPPARIAAGVNPGDLLAVSATNLQAVRLDQGRRLMRRLREKEPIAMIGYSVLVYRADFSWTPE